MVGGLLWILGNTRVNVVSNSSAGCRSNAGQGRAIQTMACGQHQLPTCLRAADKSIRVSASRCEEFGAGKPYALMLSRGLLALVGQLFRGRFPHRQGLNVERFIQHTSGTGQCIFAQFQAHESFG